jgi:hypothetical protein
MVLITSIINSSAVAVQQGQKEGKTNATVGCADLVGVRRILRAGALLNGGR